MRCIYGVDGICIETGWCVCQCLNTYSGKPLECLCQCILYGWSFGRLPLASSTGGKPLINSWNAKRIRIPSCSQVLQPPLGLTIWKRFIKMIMMIDDIVARKLPLIKVTLAIFFLSCGALLCNNSTRWNTGAARPLMAHGRRPPPIQVSGPFQDAESMNSNAAWVFFLKPRLETGALIRASK